MAKKNISFGIDEKLHETIQKKAEQIGLSPASYSRMLVMKTLSD